MTRVEFTQAERAEMVVRIQNFFENELDQTIGTLAAEQVIAFFTDQLGGFYYNRGLADAQAVFGRQLDEINDAIYALEQREARVR